MTLEDQLSRVKEIQLCEVEGMYACLKGAPVEDCPYDEEHKHNAWVLGYQEQEHELELSAKVISLRQVLKSQAMMQGNETDNDEMWWVKNLSKDAYQALINNPPHVSVLENIVKDAIAFSTCENGNESELKEKLSQSVTKYLKTRENYE